MRKEFRIVLTFLAILICMLSLYFRIPQIKVFNINDYSSYLRQYPCDYVVEPIHNLNEAIITAKKLWNIIYDTNNESTADIIAYYDDNSHAWLLHRREGITLNNGNISFGGSPYMIVDGDSGRILAVWHTK